MTFQLTNKVNTTQNSCWQTFVCTDQTSTRAGYILYWHKSCYPGKLNSKCLWWYISGEHYITDGARTQEPQSLVWTFDQTTDSILWAEVKSQSLYDPPVDWFASTSTLFCGHLFSCYFPSSTSLVFILCTCGLLQTPPTSWVFHYLSVGTPHFLFVPYLQVMFSYVSSTHKPHFKFFDFCFCFVILEIVY